MGISDVGSLVMFKIVREGREVLDSWFVIA